MKPFLSIFLVITGLLCFHDAAAQKNADKDVWVVFADTLQETYGYKNLKGDVVIPAGKYSFCFTDTFRAYAVVALMNHGFVAIDRKEHILYAIFPYDNGPDYEADGLFRIVDDGKMGYAAASTGAIIIPPQYACAWPFEHGKAKVSMVCDTKTDGEHSIWLSDKWFYIDKQGRKVK